MNTNFPQDPIILLSYVNTQLRDHYATLAEFCAAMGADRAELEKKAPGRRLRVRPGAKCVCVICFL